MTLFTIGIACLALLGWALRLPSLMSVFPGMASMKVNTAAELLLLASAVLSIHRSGRQDPARRKSVNLIAWLCCGATVLLCALTAAEYLLHVDLHIDNAVWADRTSVSFPGRNAPMTVVCFTVAAVSLLLIEFQSTIGVAQGLLAGLIVVPLATLGGYLYGAPGMYANVAYPVIALNTSVALILLCVAGLLLRPGEGLMTVVSSDTIAGTVARRLLPLSALLPLGVGLVTLAGESLGLYSRPFGAAMLIACCAILFAAAVWGTATLLYQADTHRARAEASARDYADRFREFADRMPLMVWTANANGVVDYYNQHWYEYTGLTPGSFGDASWLPLLHTDDTSRVIQTWYDAVQTGQPYECEHRLLDRQSGEYRWHVGRAVAVRGPTGQITRWYGSTGDIDQLKRAHQTARQAQAQAECASQAKDQFLAILSHELRTPLTPVMATLELLQSRSDLPTEVVDDLQMMQRNVALEAHLINDLLDITRLTKDKVALRPRPIDAHEAVRQAIQTCEADARSAGITFETHLHARHTRLNADAPRLQQVLINLLQNAVKFSLRGDVVEVRTTDAAGRFQLQVIDQGVGIPADVLPRLFQPFEQGERSITRRYGGLGLGLAICKAIVDLHEGTLTVASAGSGTGATFTLALKSQPAVGGVDPASPQALPMSLAGTGRGRGRVLLVEDHVDTRRVMTRLVKSFGFDVVAVGTVSDAVATGRREHFDLLLSDIGLPDGSGYDVMRQLGTAEGLRGIAISGFGQDLDRRRSEEAGFAAHLVKPVDLSTLAATIEQTLASVAAA